jgi:hypothetical protein
VTPPGPADFEHNGSNTESVRAQVNAYVEANKVRDLVILHNPAYPSVSTEEYFPVYVNRTDGYCPGNAWYSSAQSINFCSAGGDYPNTAWSGVVHHEYGHRLVNAAGSGQGQYGEGMGDVMGLLLSDDPGCGGYGFYGDCATSLRSADNTLQYPCSGGIHYCGQLLSGCVWDTRNELVVTEPEAYLDIISNLAINAMLVHTGDLITPQITIDFLTLDDDDGNIGNGTPHRDEICAGFGAHNMDCPPLDAGMRVTPEEDFISEGPTGGPFAPNNKIYTVKNLGPNPINYAVSKTQDWFSITNASGSLEVDEIVEVAVSINTDANFLPGGLFYDDVVTFTNTTNDEGNTTREVSLGVGYQPAYTWSLDTDPGWSTEGDWAFGQATGGGGEYGGPDPTSGYNGNNVYGYNLNGDYPNYLPEQHLTSQAIDCTDLSQVSLRFWRWLGVEQPLWDHAYVRVSNNGVSWTTVWENTAEITDSEWTQVEYDVSSVADNQPTLYLRWTMGTTDTAWRYCGWNIDDIQIYAFGGEETCTVDAECDDDNPCTDDACIGGACQNTPNTEPCDDGNACTTGDTCSQGTCGGSPVDCDDNNVCTDDSCDPVTGCVNTDNEAPCDDGNACTTGDTCSAGDCVGGPALDCDDGNGCTDDSCDSATGCVQTDNTASCDDGDACTTGDRCADGGCVGGPPPECGLADGCCGPDCSSIEDQDCGGSDPCADCFKGVCDEVCHPVKDGPGCPDCAPSFCGDGICEGDENPCTCAADCGAPPDNETGYCADGVDNDCDGPVDCDDSNDCSGDPTCSNSCLERGLPCELDAQCCSKRCHPVKGTCK